MARINPNGNSGLTNAQKWSLEGKAKSGWKLYFTEREYTYELLETRNNVRPVVQAIRNGETPDIEHLTKMFLELYDKVGEITDCPVCFDGMTKENTTVPMCGHLVCKACKAKLEECPICRKKY